MIRTLKALGAALVAVFALSALLASAAQAEETPTFTASKSPVRETGSQTANHVIKVNGGTIKCLEAKLVDEAGGSAMMLLFQPTYAKCTLAGIAATINMNGCEYTFEPVTKKEEDKFVGTMGIVCPVGKAIEVSAGGCVVAISAQAGLSTVEFTNDTKAEPAADETWSTNLAGGQYTEGKLCPGGGGTFNNLTYTGGTVVKGESEGGEPIGLWIS